LKALIFLDDRMFAGRESVQFRDALMFKFLILFACILVVIISMRKQQVKH
jgi:hypothetical protein